MRIGKLSMTNELRHTELVEVFNYIPFFVASRKEDSRFRYTEFQRGRRPRHYQKVMTQSKYNIAHDFNHGVKSRERNS